jgi:enoyl-CoA hydratase/carnithine racemase
MAKNRIDIETDNFSSKQKEDVCFVNLHKNSIEILTRIDVRDQFLSTLTKIDESENITGLVIANSATYKGDVETRNLISHLSEVFRSRIEDREVPRFKNSILQLINIFINYTKPTIAAINGDIGQTLFGLGLACDFRFATSNTHFHFPNIKLGLPTDGVLAYYLIQYIGRQRTTDLLLTKTSISASEAKDMGLLTGVTTDENLITDCLEKLNVINQYPSYGIKAVKRVLQPNAADVTGFIEKAFHEFILNLLMVKNRDDL